MKRCPLTVDAYASDASGTLVTVRGRLNAWPGHGALYGLLAVCLYQKRLELDRDWLADFDLEMMSYDEFTGGSMLIWVIERLSQRQRSWENLQWWPLKPRGTRMSWHPLISGPLHIMLTTDGTIQNILKIEREPLAATLIINCDLSVRKVKNISENC